MARYRFALRPRWILSHLLVAALVVGFLSAGFWQLDRLQEKRDRNDRVAGRSELATVPVGELVQADDPSSVGGDLEYRRVTATGTYLADDEVIVQSRSRNGAPGSWVLTPLQLADGSAVVVNRGWFENNGRFTAVPAELRAPDGEVSVTGLLRVPEVRGSVGPRDPADGVLSSLSRVDVARLDQQVDADLLPVYLQLEQQDPEVTRADPSPEPAPALDEGPHLSYSVQWFIFTTIALVGYPLILRRRAGEVEREALPAADPVEEPVGV